MAADQNHIDGVFAVKYLGLQTLLITSFSLMALFFSDEACLSSFIGGAIALSGNFYAIRKVLKPVKTESAGTVLTSLYLAELGKVAFTLLLFFMAFKWVAPLRSLENLGFMLFTFALAQSVHLFAHRINRKILAA